MKNIIKNKKSLLGIILVIVILATSIYFIVNKIKESSKIDIADNIKTVSDDEIWCATFQIAWNELIDELNLSKIEFENEESELVQKLNNSAFTKEMLSENDYYLKVQNPPFNTDKLKESIYNDVKNKFNIKQLDLLNQLNINGTNGVFIYSILEKDFEFIEEFSTFSSNYLETNQEVRCFGINSSDNLAYQYVSVMYYDSNLDNYAVKIDTQNNEEVIIYKTDTQGDLEEIYNELVVLSEIYDGEKAFNKHDYLTVPTINVNLNINYDELCGKKIIGTDNTYISNALQTIQFELDNKGGKLKSEALVKTDTLASIPMSSRNFNFCEPNCYLFLKEKNKEKPYFALKINSEFLEETTSAIQIPKSEEENQVVLQQEVKEENLPEADTSVSAEEEEMIERLNEEADEEKERYEKVKEILISYYGEDYINNMYDKAEGTFDEISKKGNLLVENKDTEAIYELILEVVKNQKLNSTDKDLLLEQLDTYVNGVNVIDEELKNEINETIDNLK